MTCMLSRLIIKKLALIDELEINFSGGMNVLSGETGAGKSIIVDSVNLVLGERADRELIRAGEQNASVEAWFDSVPDAVNAILAAQQIEASGELVISRELSVSGKNVCRVNGVLVTLSLLKEIGETLVDIHGQHEHQSLFNEKNHLKMLDSFEPEIASLREDVAKSFAQYSEALKRLRSLFGDEGDREREIDILKFQINEIREANIARGEEEELLARKKRMNASEEIMRALGSSYESIYGAEDNVLAALKDAAAKLRSLSRVDERYENMAASVEEAYYSLEGIASDIRAEMDSVSFDVGELEEVENRLSLISALKRKYKDPAVDGEFIANARQRLGDLLDSERLEKELSQKARELKSVLYEKSVRLSELRRRTAESFSRKVVSELFDLGMNSASFSVSFNEPPSPDECDFSADGIDTAEFYISTNRGEPEKPLRKVASGGEVSRIMLALKNIAADKGGIPTMIFDEIDTGISGRIAQVVAEKLKNISASRQVVCVTHLPQIASAAGRHFLISKESGETRTNTFLTELYGEDRVAEIARLSGGDSEAAKEHAREMLKKSAGMSV